jgi:hypothetical protein
VTLKTRTRNPQVEVRIYSHRFGPIPVKAVARALQDVTTSMRMGDAAGAFQMTLAPIVPWAKFGLPRKRWDDLISPMDYIEIWMWEPPRDKQIIMRGFVDAVGESFAMGPDAPNRQVIVAGRNYGKLLQISKLWYVANAATLAQAGSDAQINALFKAWKKAYDKLISRFGDGSPGPADQEAMKSAVATAGSLPKTGPFFKPQDVMELIYDGMYQPQEEVVLDSFKPALWLPKLEMVMEVQDTKDSILAMWSPYSIPLTWQPFQDIWSMFTAYQHHPWRELFIQEGYYAPRLVYRNTPWLDKAGDKLYPWGPSVVVHKLNLTNECAWSIFRGDHDVKNFFFVLSGEMAGYAHSMKGFTGPYEGAAQGGFNKNPYLIGGTTGQPNSYQRFGIRLHEAPTPYLNFERAWSKDDIKKRIADVRRQGVIDCGTLVQALGHEEVLERGWMLVPGDERIQIGHYAYFSPNPSMPGWYYYIEALQQNFRCGPGYEDGRWQTRLDVTRGRGYVTREAGSLDIRIPGAGAIV